MPKLTKETREAFIKEYGENNLRRVILPLDEINKEHIEVTVVIPSRRVTGMFMKFMDTNPLKAQEILVKNCLLTDKEQVMNDDALFFTLASNLGELVPIREGIVKKF